MANLSEIAAKINKDWVNSYTAIVQDNEVRLHHKQMVIATIDLKGDVEILEEGFEEEIEQLIYTYSIC